ncbi:two component transcriptional regulator, LuxR family [Sphingomonas gellani]|uniref:Two component transcriptional regulator, LuxR family n=1 Tax=Sphingomonas gellani TaxID=1166340 RepID=A0A1H8JF02_9SPHN|nr:response regulator [Sphingomonas gellani]SEN79300.1 two component transcriptional regulator, LuxR family [Sphingomonas gellani]
MTRPVYLVDDDDALRGEMNEALTTAGFHTVAFADGCGFIAAVGELEPGCVVLDLTMPRCDGLMVLDAIRRAGAAHSAVMLTGHGSIPVAVAAMQAGAVNFLEKPFSLRKLVVAVEQGLARLDADDHERTGRIQASTALARLSAREREVLQGMVDGLPNKLIAHRLGLSTRTVEVYRANTLTKLGTKSLSDAVKIALAGA